MKTKAKCFTLLSLSIPLVLITAFWGTWSFAYQRGFRQGYAQGSSDEFYCWKQEPILLNDSWDGKLKASRDFNKLLGGKSIPQVVQTPVFEFDKQIGKVIGRNDGAGLTKMDSLTGA